MLLTLTRQYPALLRVAELDQDSLAVQKTFWDAYEVAWLCKAVGTQLGSRESAPPLVLADI